VTTFEIKYPYDGERPASRCDAKKGREADQRTWKPNGPPPSPETNSTGALRNRLGILRPYIPASWFHERGLCKVLARLTPRLPNVDGRLFLTFTFDPSKFPNPSAAFESGRDRLRRIFFRLRRGVAWEGKTYLIDAPYCVKVEFHANGWAHFHVVFLTRRFLPGPLLNSLWTHGRTNVKRIKAGEFRYLLKYVTKGGQIPDWVLSRGRLRVFQSSRGFLSPTEKAKETDNTKDQIPRRRREVKTIGQRLERWSRTALFQKGKQFSLLSLTKKFRSLFDDLVFPAAEEGRYLGGGFFLINDENQLNEWI
jgi:hypothetical protein